MFFDEVIEVKNSEVLDFVPNSKKRKESSSNLTKPQKMRKINKQVGN